MRAHLNWLQVLELQGCSISATGLAALASLAQGSHPAGEEACTLCTATSGSTTTTPTSSSGLPSLRVLRLGNNPLALSTTVSTNTSKDPTTSGHHPTSDIGGSSLPEELAREADAAPASITAAAADESKDEVAAISGSGSGAVASPGSAAVGHALAQLLQHAPVLQELHLGSSSFGPQGAAALAGGLAHARALTLLDISGCEVDAAVG